jgi:hypothetical protein
MGKSMSVNPVTDPNAVVAEPAAAIDVAAVPAADVVVPEAAPVAAEPVTEAAPTPEIAQHTDIPSLLEEAGNPADANPEDVKPAEDAKPAEVVAEPLKYEPFTLPEGVKLDEERVGEYTGILSEYGIPQEAGQKLLDLYTNAAKTFVEHTSAEQHRVFGEVRAAWRSEIMADPEMGGSGYHTTSAAVARMRDLFVPENDRQAFNDFLRVTGAGDHPQFWKLLHRVSQRFDEPSPAPLPNGPAPDAGRMTGAKGRRASLYTHPSSQRRSG